VKPSRGAASSEGAVSTFRRDRREDRSSVVANNKTPSRAGQPVARARVKVALRGVANPLRALVALLRMGQREANGDRTSLTRPSPEGDLIGHAVFGNHSTADGSWGFTPDGWISSIIGAIIVLWAYLAFAGGGRRIG